MRVFYGELSLEVTIRELARKANLSYNATYRTIQFLVGKDLLRLRRFGHASAISLNTENPATIALLASVAYEYTAQEIQKPTWREAKQLVDNHYFDAAISVVVTNHPEPSFIIITDSPLLDHIKETMCNTLPPNTMFVTPKLYKRTMAKKQQQLIISGAEHLLTHLLT